MVDLRRLDNLKRNLVAAVASEIRASARLALVFHHAAHAHRAVELAIEEVDFLDFVVSLEEIGDINHQLVFCESGDFVKFLVGDVAVVKQLQILKLLLLQTEEVAAKHLFIFISGVLQAVRNHIVDVLDEDDFLV